jgi:hypothetical protein
MNLRHAAALALPREERAAKNAIDRLRARLVSQP